MTIKDDALILLSAVPDLHETGAAKWVEEAAHILRQVAYSQSEADDVTETLWGALGDLTREAAKHINKGDDGYAFLAHAQDLVKRRNAPEESK